jgi:hypothetical protein
MFTVDVSALKLNRRHKVFQSTLPSCAALRVLALVLADNCASRNAGIA